MRKIFGVLILLTVLIVGGCTHSEMTIDTTDSEVKISAKNADEGGGDAEIQIPDGSTLQVDAKISAGKLIIRVNDKEHAFDKSGEFFVDVPTGHQRLFITAQNGLTGEIILRALPKI